MAAVRRHHLLLSIIILLSSSFFRPSLSQPPPVVSRALLQFKKSLTNSETLVNWIDDGKSNPCDPKHLWVGVNCVGSTVATLKLSNLGLEGKPDIAALEVLDGLKAISVENNSLSGPLPEFNRLTHVKAIYASKNQFSGEIPAEYFKPLVTLKKLWISNNRFTGPLPTSIIELTNLKELHLEYNEFSGPVPDFPEPNVLTAFDVANNKLQGQIPKSMHKFGAKAFDNNADLCGPPTNRLCEQHLDTPHEGTTEDPKSSKTKWIILGIVVSLLIVTVMVNAKKKDDNVRTLGKETPEEAVVNIPNTTRRTTSSGRKGYNNLSTSGKTNEDASTRSSKKGSQHGGRSVGDLVVVNDQRGIFGLQDLMKAAAEVLGNGGLGSAYKAMMSNGVCVVVKRVREMNKMTKDVFDTEMRRLGVLKHPNILTPLAYHYRKEEKLLVSEYVPKGSLLYVLHGDRGICHAELNWPNRLKIIQGVARGMGFLHSEFASYELPHGNLKSSNVLLGPNYDPLLSDYAFHPLINTTPTAQSMFAYKSPEAVLYQQVSHKSDVYCLGIIILEVITGKYPSQYLTNQKGGTDVVQWVRSALAEKREAELIDPEISSSAKESLGQMEKLLHIGAACTENEHEQRIDLNEAIRRIEEVSV